MAAMKKKYRVRDGSRIRHKDAQRIGEILDSLGDHYTASDVVKAAEDKKSVLHCYFEWDDETAASKHRLYQARTIASSIEIYIEITHEWTRAYHHVKIENSKTIEAYRPIDILIQHQDESDQIVDRACAELQSWTERWNQYRSLFPKMFTQVKKAIKK